MMERKNNSAGFTLVEMMIGLLVGSMLIIVSYNVLTSQKKAADDQNNFVNAQQNARVALETLEKDLRLAGLNIDDFNGQPVFVDAAPYQVTFNADISSGISGVLGMTVDQGVMRSDGVEYIVGTLPGEAIGALTRYNNNAETIRYTLDDDDDGLVGNTDLHAQTQNPSDFAIYREENGHKKDMIASGVRGRTNYPDGQFPEPVFKYYGDFNGTGLITLWGDGNGNGFLEQAEIAAITPVSDNLLSRIMEVEVTVEAESAVMQAGFSGDHSAPNMPRNYRNVVMKSKIRSRNVGTGSATLHACGNPPGPASSLSSADDPKDDGTSIILTFNPSFDEQSGETDVNSYTVYRREDGVAIWECVGMVVPQGLTSYTYNDDPSSPAGGPKTGVGYYYYVTAWDCRPQESSPSNVTGPVIAVPNGPEPPSITRAFDTPCDSEDEISVVLHKSPDDLGGGSTLVEKYEIYRGIESDGSILSKSLIGTLSADGSESYTFLDNETYNLSGVPPETGDYYYYMARAIKGGADAIPSIASNEYGGVYYAGKNKVSACELESVTDYPDDEGDALVLVWMKSPSEDCSGSEVAGYVVERKSIFEPSWTTVFGNPPSGATTYTYTDFGLTRGAEYTYRVLTCSTASDEVPSNEKSAIPMRNTELDPPENLAAEDILCDATGSVNVTFENAPQDIPSGRVTHYKIYRKQDFGTFSVIGEIPASAAESYLYVDGPAANPTSPPIIGEFYYYKATAFDIDHDRESAPSNEGYTMSDGEPGAPRITGAYDTPVDAGGSITIDFDRSADDGHCTNNVIIYRVYRETASVGPWSHVVGEMTAVGALNYTFVDDELFSLDPPVDGLGYYYVIRAIEEGGEESVNSNVAGPVYSICQEASSYIVFDDDFETDKGWTHVQLRTQDDWQRGMPMGNGGDDSGEDDPSSAHGGNNVFGNDLGGDGWNGSYKNNTDNELITPAGAIDCAGHANMVLQFYRWLNVEAPAYDRARIYISTTGTAGPWTKIWENPNEITDNSWVFVELDISEWADGEEDVALRFRLTSDGAHIYSGWNIDDIVVREKAATP